MKKIAFAIAAMGFISVASASTISYSFTDVQDGVSGTHLGTSHSVATLTIGDSTETRAGFSKAYEFSLTNTFDTSLKTPADAKVFDLVFSSGNVYGLAVTSTASGFEFNSTQNDLSGGIKTGIDYGKFAIAFKTAAAKSFTNNETAKWVIFGNDDLKATSFGNFLLHVNATGGYYNNLGNFSNNAGTASIRFAAAQNETPPPPPPVPEPETYAMLLAGLGLMGVLARHRKQQ
jgi:hypothetical protein